MTEAQPRAPGLGLDDVTFRRPAETDYLTVVRDIDDWWGGERRLDVLLPRLWFQHFTGTSWIAESADGRIAGFLVGFISADRPDLGYVHMVGVHPSRRGRGLGRALYERFFEDVRTRGGVRVAAVTSPHNKPSLAFHRAIGFSIDDGPGTQNLYGTPSYAGYDFGREDRVVLVRSI